MVLQKLAVSSLFSPLLLWVLFVSGHQSLVECASRHHHRHHRTHHADDHRAMFRPTKMFVFGDSYADTGNSPNPGDPWSAPYGITYPGRPTGRYSDGLVLTDFLALHFGVRSPIPYERRKVEPKYVDYGMNFAYGGSGVFQQPNMTFQIDLFQQLIAESVYTRRDLQCSLALVTNSGNDYSKYSASLDNNGSYKDLRKLTIKVVNQLVLDIKRIHDLGVKMIAVAGLPPLGCLPEITVLHCNRTCNANANKWATFHNQLLREAVAKLNNQTRSSPAFVFVHLYSSFMSVLKGKGSTKFREPLIPCMCETGQKKCDGQKKCEQCKDPKGRFFWDTQHPTQEGWRAVVAALGSDLKQL